MNPKITQTLEFNQVLAKINHYTVTVQGQQVVRNLQPYTEREKIGKALQETQEGQDVLRLEGGIPVAQLVDVQPHIKRLEIGADLNGQELAEMTRLLMNTRELVRFFEDQVEKDRAFPALNEWIAKLVHLPTVARSLQQALEEDGRLKDEASPELYQLRQQIRRSERLIREQLDQFVRGKNARYLSDQIITLRNERYVIPVKQEYRGVFGGVVHDQSASGQTLFIEPKQVVELNNRLRQQQVAEREEMLRIFAELSALLAPHLAEIRQNVYVVGQLDAIQAKARYAKEIKAIVPTVNEQEQVVELLAARHPLLDPEQAVANDIRIGTDYQAIVITGPNTGGKTITLKTLGLLQLMGQTGLALPVKETSSIGIFTEIFADIGDEQSIEQSLSTFSSHMTNIVRILAAVDARSLVLFDELGAGTDPQEGAALAIAILDTLGAIGSTVMATTHYPELKAYGYNRPGTINASMEFDSETLRPTYRFLIGVPGRSNAFEISRRLGLEDTVIAQAQQLMHSESQDLNKMIGDLDAKRKAAEAKQAALARELAEAQTVHQDLQEHYALLVKEKDQQLAAAREKANEIVTKAEQEADKIIRDLRQRQLAAEQGLVKEHEMIAAKANLANLHSSDTAHLERNKVLQKAKKAKELKVGDEVFVETYGQRGTLIRKKGTQWQVEMGILKMMIDENELRPVVSAAAEEKTQRHITTIRQASEHVPAQLDLRGVRYEEAMAQVDQYIDSALLAGYNQVTIVHGKGTGALREGITAYLKKNKRVAQFGFAPGNQGGNGATIVTFG